MDEQFKPDWARDHDNPDGINSLSPVEARRVMCERVRLLHIYAQPDNHCTALIVGNRNALIVLRDAIDAALASGKAETGAVTTDGEGYSVEIVRDNNDWTSPSWKKRSLPYTGL